VGRVNTDVLVIGGGPAGLASAIAARRRGFSVTLADPAHPPIDKACGEGLMPDAIEALATLGVPLPASMGQVFRGIRFISGDLSAEANFSSGIGLGVRRTTLHQVLAECAAQAGVDLRWGTPVVNLTASEAVLGDDEISYCWLIGADGGTSRVRRWAGFKVWERPVRYGFRRHYRVAPWSGMVEVHWGPSFQIYVAPLGAEEVGIALLCRDSGLRIDDALEYFPELSARLEDAAHLSSERGGISAMRKLPSVTQGNIALVGDASGAVDAITGQGLCLCFEQALALADCLETGDLEVYEIAHRRIMRRPRWMANFLLLLDAQPRARAAAMRTFERHPALFAALLAYHVGAMGKKVENLIAQLRFEMFPSSHKRLGKPR
jgi:flavin-dependent dehydrogenase